MLKKMYYWFRDKTSPEQERGERSAGAWQNAVRKAAFELIRSAPGRLLEVGCGEGLFLKKIADDNASVHAAGIELSPEQLIRARKRLVGSAIPLVCADATKLPFKESVFDTIVCVNVFLNMPDEKLMDAALNEMRRVAATGAKTIFEIRNRSNAVVYWKYKLAKFYDATIDVNRLRMYRASDIEKKVKALGFRVNKKIGIGFPGGMSAPIILFEVEKC